MARFSATAPTSGALRSPLFFPESREERREESHELSKAISASSEGQWLANVDRYYASHEINEPMRQWLKGPVRWLEIERATPVYGLLRLIGDRLAALILVVLLSPVMFMTALAIKLASPGPVFYVQTRVGRGCRAFRIYKFRTMSVNADRAVPFDANKMNGGMFKVPNDPRVIPVGRVLRRWSLDELPQLFNVIKGEMALIGPRPLELEHACAVPERYLDRFALRPGITGLWQATARDLRDGTVKLAMDAEYVHRRSLKLDSFLLVKTLTTVLRGIGAD